MSKKVLVIEPDSFIRDHMEELLEIDNYIPLMAENADTGIALAIAHHPDIIFSELSKPDLIGLTVFKTLKQEPTTRHIPIILIFTYMNPEMLALLQELRHQPIKPDEFMIKPFAGDEIITVIKIYTSEKLHNTWHEAKKIPRRCSTTRDKLNRNVFSQ